MRRITIVVGTAVAAVALAAAPAAAVPADLRTPQVDNSPAATLDVRSPDARDGTGAATPVAPEPVVVEVPVTAPTATGADWGTAVLGAASGLALAFVVGGGLMLAGRRRAQHA